MSLETQSDISLGIVLFTAAAFLVRYVRRKMRKGCGGGCGCAAAKDKL
jgi:hypothetical protein